jgi:type I restriction enzyme, S subunit
VTGYRLKSVVTCSVEKSDGKTRPFIGLEDIGSGTGSLLTGELSTKAALDSVLHRPGDVLFSKLRPYLAKSLLAESPGSGTGELLVLRPQKGINNRFLLYSTLSSPWLDWAETTSYGTKMPRTSWEAMSEYRINLPPIEEQRRIADFLDAETARIDQLMSAQLRILDLLEERANSRILELIGQSLLVRREGAAIVPMRRVIKKLSRPVMPTDEVITAFRDGQVTSRSIRRSEGYTLAANTEPQGQGVEAGDIVVHGLDGFAGAIGDSEASGNCSPVYHVCTPIDGGNSAFYGRLLRLLALSDYLALFGASARERAVDFRNWQIFGHASIPQARPREQHEIGNFITRIRPLREEVKRFNERLAERRKALITAAVTGQFDVTTAARRAAV